MFEIEQMAQRMIAERERYLNSLSSEERAKMEEAERRLVETQEAERKERAARARENARQSLGIAKRHWDFPLPENGPWRQLYDRLVKRLGLGYIAVLLGARGTGKTQLASSIVLERAKQGKSSGSRYCKAMDFFLDLRASFKSDQLTEQQVIQRYASIGFLVIDALEEKSDSDFEIRALDHLIDLRYREMKDTILISNHTRKAAADSLGPSIVSRIHECGEVIECDWPSFRSPSGTPQSGSHTGGR